MGKTALECNFRERFKAAIVAYQRGGKSGQSQSLSAIKFMVGDILILQANDDSPLLVLPPEDFEKSLKLKRTRSGSGSSLSEMLRNISNGELNLLGLKKSKDDDSLSKKAEESSVGSQSLQPSLIDEGNEFGFMSDDHSTTKIHGGEKNITHQDEEDGINMLEMEEVWTDLKVIKSDGVKSVSREFLTAMEIIASSPFIKKTATHTGLDKLSGVFLVEIERPMKPVNVKSTPQTLNSNSDKQTSIMQESHHRTLSTEDLLQGGDVLWFAGSAKAIGDLRKIPGMKPFEDDQVKKVEGDYHQRRLVQAVIAKHGPLVGKTVKDIRFRTRYGAAVIAVQRQGNRVHDHPGRVVLQAGDVLLLEAGPSFVAKNANIDKSFALLSEIKDSAPPRLRLLIPALLLTAVALTVYTADVASLLVCALIAAILMVFFGILTQQEARDAINWEVYITIASAFGIGTALTNSGLAGNIADFLVSIGNVLAIGDAGLFGAVYFATFLISNVVTNNAAAALIFPIAIDSAEQTGADVLLMSYCVMLGASASFMSPFGYTTNLLIYGPGSYKYADFLRIGTPMQIVLWIFSIALLTIEEAYMGWIISFAIFFVVILFRMSSLASCFQITSK